MDHSKFEQEMLQRPMLADDSSFAERIIAAARMHEQAPSWQARLQSWLQEAGQLLPFPKPAYAFSVIAIAGFMLGVISQPAEAISTPANLSALLYETTEVI